MALCNVLHFVLRPEQSREVRDPAFFTARFISFFFLSDFSKFLPSILVADADAGGSTSRVNNNSRSRVTIVDEQPQYFFPPPSAEHSPWAQQLQQQTSGETLALRLS